MINREATAGGVIGTIFSSVGAGLSIEQVQQIISIISTCIGAIIVIVSGIIIPLWKWWKKAKADGKISKEEIDEAKEIINNGSENVKNVIDKKD